MDEFPPARPEGPSRTPVQGGGSSWPRALTALAAVVLGGLYLLNLLGGVDELVPDHIVLWGNLDEALAAVLFLGGCRFLFRTRSPVR